MQLGGQAGVEAERWKKLNGKRLGCPVGQSGRRQRHRVMTCQ